VKKSQKDLALQRIEILMRNALKTSKDNPELARRQAQLAKNMGMKFRVRLPYEIRQLFCKKCKSLIIPGQSARVRLGRTKVRALRITCLKCGHMYRKLIR
jgi:ribonuclease P protein subunit RPR2